MYETQDHTIHGVVVIHCTLDQNTHKTKNMTTDKRPIILGVQLQNFWH